VVTLLTDFGTRDVYVGVMKGVIAGLAPRARVVDLTHEVSPQAVVEAAFLLDSAVPYFPPGTIHVAVVDPGVGTSRRIVCARTPRATFVAPDNGLLTRVLERDPATQIVAVENSNCFLPEVSTTFHGRDVFAPVAAHLANGLDLGELGAEVSELLAFDLPRVRETGPGVYAGEGIHVDHCGNLVTNVPVATCGDVEVLSLGTQQVEGPLRRSYGECDEGALFLVGGSSGFLEVSVNQGSAAERLSARRGDAVEVRSASREGSEVS
jgi:S-adenosylmethionine hydrolase